MGLRVSLGVPKDTTLRSSGGPALRISGPGSRSAMVRNLKLVAAPDAAAVEILTEELWILVLRWSDYISDVNYLLCMYLLMILLLYCYWFIWSYLIVSDYLILMILFAVDIGEYRPCLMREGREDSRWLIAKTCCFQALGARSRLEIQ